MQFIFPLGGLFRRSIRIDDNDSIFCLPPPHASPSFHHASSSLLVGLRVQPTYVDGRFLDSYFSEKIVAYCLGSDIRTSTKRESIESKLKPLIVQLIASKLDSEIYTNDGLIADDTKLSLHSTH